jgi:hypothetical protein
MGRIKWIGLIFMLGLSAAVLASCGGGGGEQKSATERTAKACEGAALGTEPELPADFPKPGEVTYLTAGEQGPTLVIEGYFEGELKNAYEDYKRGFEGAGYDILFDELEDRDSEISYRDAEGKTAGQVALRDECEEQGRISVHITNRPA